MNPTEKSKSLNLRAVFQNGTKEDMPDALRALVFDSRGKFLTETPLKFGGEADKDGGGMVGQAGLAIPNEYVGRTIRVVIAPPVDQNEGQDKDQRLPNINELLKLGLTEQRLRFDPKKPILWRLSEPLWKLLIFCRCTVRGRLIKRVYLPDGQTLELPICHSKVTLSTVSRFRWIIDQLPDTDIFRLRDDLFREVIKLPPIPPFPPEGPFPDPRKFEAFDKVRPHLLMGNETLRGFESRSDFAKSRINTASLKPNLNEGLVKRDTFVPQKFENNEFQSTSVAKMRDILLVNSALELRNNLVSEVERFLPYFCHITWLDRWFYFQTQVAAVVEVDESGYFEATIWYPCRGPKPNIYISVEQWTGSVWNPIYKPAVRCHTYWNYSCGSLITINVTDPTAEVCNPSIPVIPPSGIGTWVMPFSIGGTKIWGTGGVGPAPLGWVRADGKTDYGGFLNAPFGATLSFTQATSLNIPNANQYYYRWSYRKGTTGDFEAMTTSIGRTYIRQMPGKLPSFPNYNLGPRLNDLFRFKPQIFPSSEVATAADPAGTIYGWPVDNFTGDIYSAHWPTDTHPTNVTETSLRAGDYQVKLEVFNQSGVLVPPGPASFQFIVPNGLEPDGVTLTARSALAAEIDNGGLVFNVHIDNGRCSANIDPPVANGTMMTDDCGFLRYTPGSNIGISFQAVHPRNQAEFSFSIIRGIVGIPAASVLEAEVGTVAAGAFAGNGSGAFSHVFADSVLLGTCPNAAFAESLYVTGKATNGTTRIGYDASALRAFALAL
jgi:hypothetical protein